MAVPLDEPFPIVAFLELDKGETKLLDGLKRLDPQALLFQRGK